MKYKRTDSIILKFDFKLKKIVLSSKSIKTLQSKFGFVKKKTDETKSDWGVLKS